MYYATTQAEAKIENKEARKHLYHESHVKSQVLNLAAFRQGLA